MNNEEKKLTELDIKSLYFVKVKNEIEVSMQHLDNLKQVLEFNTLNDYKYAITNGDSNLLGVECICYLINNDYIITNKYDKDKLVFKHKNLIAREEKEQEEIKEMRRSR